MTSPFLFLSEIHWVSSASGGFPTMLSQKGELQQREHTRCNLWLGYVQVFAPTI